ncbi:helix-turn-helix transcriptional regulator [Sphingobium sp. CFD-2]|uniref:helix-turn-helix transcriptional regulator n=1 Tax=Sphingobium sp. CFD-2 TaxID=2878542 RepID=UPI00214BF11E|nr:helix-turn-helix transcriptional regulator [Sphingobium sp. CFD-2]
MAEGSIADGESIFASWVDADPIPHAIIDRSLRLHWQNRAATALLQHSSELQEQDGRLFALQPANHARLKLFAAHAGSDASSSMVILPVADDYLILRGRPIGASGRGEQGEQIGIMFFSAKHFIDQSIVSGDVKDIYRLTNGEYKILSAMMSGMNAEQISGNLEISLETVRTHIRRIYSKTGVRSREALFAQLQPFKILA